MTIKVCVTLSLLFFFFFSICYFSQQFSFAAVFFLSSSTAIQLQRMFFAISVKKNETKRKKEEKIEIFVLVRNPFHPLHHDIKYFNFCFLHFFFLFFAVRLTSINCVLQMLRGCNSFACLFFFLLRFISFLIRFALLTHKHFRSCSECC